MKQIELLHQAEKELNQADVQDAHIQANMLLQYVLKQTKHQLIIKSNEPVSSKKENEYKQNINKIINGMPIQYITHKQSFMGLDFYVDENVLIPQPDTEILVQEALKLINKSKKENNNSKQILDLCTGSGAIAISILNYCTNICVTATDISESALKVAYKNAINNIKNKIGIKFIKSDLFENLKDKKFDIIVSNPPYIETETIKKLSVQVQKEPYIALNGGSEGLDFYKLILNQAHKYLYNEGYLLLEIGYNQGKKILNLPHPNLRIITQKPIKDLAGNDRVVIFKKEYKNI